MSRRTAKSALGVVVTLSIVALLGIWVIPAVALDRSDRPLRVTVDKPVIEHDYPPLPVSDPFGFTLHPEDCKSFPTCDFIPIFVEVPPGTSFYVTITISFDHAEGGNDLDLFYWEGTFPLNEEGEREETPEWVDAGSSATGGEPEVMKLGDIEPSSDSLLYALTPINFSGTPLSYHAKAEMVVQELPDVSQYDYSLEAGPKPFVRDPETGAIRFGGFGDPRRSGDATAEERLDPVKVPGADGELTEHDLLAVKGQATEEEPSRAPLVAAVVAVLALGAGTFLWFFIRSRRSVEEPT